MNNHNERIIWIDNLKGLAIYLVVFGHICSGRMLPLMDTALWWVYGFHMPLFMFVSGMLLTKISRINTFKESKTVIKQKALQLFPPFFFWGVLNCILHGSNLLNDFFLLGGAYYWYLWVLFVFIIILLIIHMISVQCRNKYLHVFIALLIITFCIIQLIPSNTTFGEFFNILYMHYDFHYFCMGYFYSLYGKRRIPWYVGFFAFILYNLVYFSGYNKELWAYFLRPGLAILAFVSLFQYIRFYLPRLKDYGQHTLYIYVIHYLVIALYPKHIVNYLSAFPVGWDVLVGLGVCTLSSLIITEISMAVGKCVNKIPRIGPFLMGNCR